MEELLEYACGSEICRITITRPKARNALSLALLEKLGTVLKKLADDTKVRALIISGTGDQAFCAGADLKERRGMSHAETLHFVKLIQETCDQFSKLPMPTIAAINGDAFGGGLELALACDMRLAAQNARMGLTECSLGIIPGAGGTQRLPLIVGVAKASELIFMAKKLSAEAALQCRLVNALAPDAEAVRNMAEDWAKDIAKNAPLALRAAKRALWAPYRAALTEGLADEYAQYQSILPTKDRDEGLNAFAEKREPHFLGH